MKREINIPTSLHEVKLRNYIAIEEVDTENESTVLVESLHAWLGIPKTTIEAMTYNSILLLAEQLAEISKQEYKPMYQFTLKGVTYGMIPDFTDTVVEFKEFIDASIHITNILNNTMKPESIPRFMAILFRPIIKDENGLIKLEPYEGSDKYKDIMLDAPASAYKGAQSFFLTLREDLKRTTLAYMEKEGEVEFQQLEQTLVANGDGMGVLETLRNLLMKQ